MLYLFGCAFIVIGFAFAAKAASVNSPWSKTLFLAVLLSLIANVALVSTIAANSNPAANEGFSVPNRIAYWIIGEDGWSMGLFQRLFDQSMWCTLWLALILAVVSISEAFGRKMRRAGSA
ncbi:hypothetical protein [Paenibacillus sp. 2TAB19]|uniref:hypothetical protein n=1 Tax=Paenibacillus sp. 2TAB19 TaxID=3233003 RepID=UPI003F95B842